MSTEKYFDWESAVVLMSRFLEVYHFDFFSIHGKKARESV